MTSFDDTAVFNDEDKIGMGEDVKRICDQETSFALKDADDSFIEEMSANVSVDLIGGSVSRLDQTEREGEVRTADRGSSNRIMSAS